MARITIYLRDEIETRARCCKEQGISVSRWIAGQLTEKLAASWPPPGLHPYWKPLVPYRTSPNWKSFAVVTATMIEDHKVVHKSSRKPQQNLADFLSESPFAGSELDLDEACELRPSDIDA